MTTNRQRRRLRITGLVQGVGFRPFLWRLARRHGLGGWVANDAAGVLVEIVGEADRIRAFLESISREAPPLARINQITEQPMPQGSDLAEPAADERLFVIRPSLGGGDKATELASDGSPCSACLAEMRDPANRRFHYPFINCTDCGPRYSIITALPYDRLRTTMAGFAMCEECQREYSDPADRRFHAQPIGCPACGPVVWFTAAGDPNGLATTRPTTGPLGEAAIHIARERLRSGQILAIKGVGGFQLLCDATSVDAVAALRSRKHRPRKPFAVMVPDRAAAERLVDLDDQSARLLGDHSRPILLLPRHSQPAVVLADAVTAGSCFLGVMLPSSPLHELLLADDQASGGALPMPPLVVTSGNVADAFLIHDNGSAAAGLATIADGFLMHDRPIQVACDDSVVRCIDGMPLPIRLARGHAPQTVRLADDGPCVLAVGGELKATLCLAHGRQAILSQHLGDVAGPDTLDALTATARHLIALTAAEPERIVADLHPGYLSTRWAAELAHAKRLPLVQVQHHEAHAAALLAEHGLSLETVEPVLVACFDGTGYGRDGTLQGSEFLLIHAGDITRVAHLTGFPLPGGDAAIRQPWRTAVGLLTAISASDTTAWPAGWLPASPEALDAVRQQTMRGIACPTTSSMGRLFDAAASLAGLCHEISFEAEAAMRLEVAAENALANQAPSTPLAFELQQHSQPWPLGGCVHSLPPQEVAVCDPQKPWLGGSPKWKKAMDAFFHGQLEIRWQPLLRRLCLDMAAGHPAGSMALGFHLAVTNLIGEVAARVRTEIAGGASAAPLRHIGLTGGVFQNRLLCEQTIAQLTHDGFEPLLPTRLPANDGGLSLGQAILGRTRD
jgi:hydrogenase maturation protein HypF